MTGTEYWWGNREIKAPPVYTCSYEMRECSDILQNTTILLDKAVKCLHCQIIWDNEHKILQKIIYKGHNQFRRDKFMKALKKINTSLKRYFELDLPQVIKNLRDNTPSALLTRKTFQLPSSQMFEYALARLLCGAHIMKQVNCYCMEAYRHISGQLNIGMFIPNMLVYGGLVSRIWALSYSKLKNVASVFKEMRIIVDRVQGAKVKWLPEGAVIPQDVDDLVHDLKLMNNFDSETEIENAPKDWLEQFDTSQEGIRDNQLTINHSDEEVEPPVERLFENITPQVEKNTTEAEISYGDIGIPIKRLDFQKHAKKEFDDLLGVSHKFDKSITKMKQGHATSTPMQGHKQTIDIAMEVGMDFSPVVNFMTSPKSCTPMTKKEKSKWKALIDKAKNIQQLMKILDVLKDNYPGLEKKYKDKRRRLNSLKVISNETESHRTLLERGKKLVRKFLIQAQNQGKIKKENNSNNVKSKTTFEMETKETLTTGKGLLSNSYKTPTKVEKELPKKKIKKSSPIKAKNKKKSKMKKETRTSASIQRHKSDTRKQKKLKKQKN